MRKIFTLLFVALVAMSLGAAPAIQLKNLSAASAESANQQRALRLINQNVTKRANPAAVAEKFCRTSRQMPGGSASSE